MTWRPTKRRLLRRLWCKIVGHKLVAVTVGWRADGSPIYGDESVCIRCYNYSWWRTDLDA